MIYCGMGRAENTGRLILIDFRRLDLFCQIAAALSTETPQLSEILRRCHLYWAGRGLFRRPSAEKPCAEAFQLHFCDGEEQPALSVQEPERARISGEKHLQQKHRALRSHFTAQNEPSPSAQYAQPFVRNHAIPTEISRCGFVSAASHSRRRRFFLIFFSSSILFFMSCHILSGKARAGA